MGEKSEIVSKFYLSPFVFLKSTDDSMIETLQKMSGTTHKAYIDSKTITRDMEKMFMKNEGKTSYTMSAKEVPVISYNDMAFISERNSIIFRAGDSPIWNRNETILPMSWRLFSNTIIQPGKDYTLQTIPTLSSALDFDVRKNQPDFIEMLNKRMMQAMMAEGITETYKKAYGYTDYQMQQLDPDVKSDEIMAVINAGIREMANVDENAEYGDEFGYDEDEFEFEDNIDVEKAVAEKSKEFERGQEKIFADGLLSRNDFYSKNGVNHAWDVMILKAYGEAKGAMEQDKVYFRPSGDGGMCSADGVPYIKAIKPDYDAINKAAKDANSKVYSEGDINEGETTKYSALVVTDEFLKFLASQDSWSFANGVFEREMAKLMVEGAMMDD